MSRVICVSNRVSLPDPRTGKIGAGGLAVGVKAALEGVGGGVWFGWSGEIDEAHPVDGRRLRREQSANISFITMSLNRAEYGGYYTGMANGFLWPVMHELADHIDVAWRDYSTYQAVNAVFAEQLLKIIRPGDVIWVHDYHLLSLGRALRRAGLAAEKNALLFFNHVPVPSVAFVRKNLSYFHRRQFVALMADLCAYDRVGFQTRRDLENYMAIMRGEEQKSFPARFETAAMIAGKQTRFGYFPISIETKTLAKTAAHEAVQPHITRLQKRLDGERLVIGADRLDYTKGLLNRVDGVSVFFKENPLYADRVRFLQITPLSRADLVQYKKTIHSLRHKVSLVNAAHSTALWQPILYTEKSVSRDMLLGLFRVASVGLVTSLMDGQNLVSKEYLAAQDPENPGVLVLSRRAGAAEEMRDAGALLIDPLDPADIAQKIRQACDMPLSERQDHHRHALTLLLQNDIDRWAQSFLDLSA